MNGTEIQKLACETATKLPLAELSYPFGEDIHVFKVLDKVFMLTSTLNEQQFVNLKVDPNESETLRELYPSIHVGYHMNKKHWISVYEGEKIDALLIEDLVKTSYQLVVNKLTKKQKQVLAIYSQIE